VEQFSEPFPGVDMGIASDYAARVGEAVVKADSRKTRRAFRENCNFPRYICKGIHNGIARPLLGDHQAEACCLQMNSKVPSKVWRHGGGDGLVTSCISSCVKAANAASISHSWGPHVIQRVSFGADFALLPSPIIIGFQGFENASGGFWWERWL